MKIGLMVALNDRLYDLLHAAPVMAEKSLHWQSFVGWLRKDYPEFNIRSIRGQDAINIFRKEDMKFLLRITKICTK